MTLIPTVNVLKPLQFAGIFQNPARQDAERGRRVRGHVHPQVEGRVPPSTAMVPLPVGGAGVGRSISFEIDSFSTCAITTAHFSPRKCSASNRLLGARDHASIQLNLAEVDKDTGRCCTLRLLFYL